MVTLRDAPAFWGDLFPDTSVDCNSNIASLIVLPDLDERVRATPSITEPLEARIAEALDAAFGCGPGDARAHLFLQRTLYQINRLSFFWFDDLSHYDNERSTYLASVRERIERRWQAWELDQLSVEPPPLMGSGRATEQALRSRAASDVAPARGPRGRFFAEAMTEPGYRRLLEIFSLDALVEASQLSRTLGGVSNHVHSYVTRVLLEEYGGGRPHHKHSAYFEEMLRYFGMDTAPEAYFEQVPWEVLANINHSFLMSERKRNYLRYMGGLLYTETSTPAAFACYAEAAERLGCPAEAYSYWTIHVKADKVHGRWMLEEIALPLAERYPQDARDLVLGYDQQAFLAERASAAMQREVMAAQDTPASVALSALQPPASGASGQSRAA